MSTDPAPVVTIDAQKPDPIEEEIRGLDLKGARITPGHIAEQIVAEHYIHPAHAPFELMTICMLGLKNGFVVVGQAACADSRNFNAELGRKIARQDAVNQVWMLEGYLLKQRLSYKPPEG